jgi:hypothetical protein
VPLDQVIWKDLSAELRSTIMEKLSFAVCQYSDFAFIFSLVVQMTMLISTISNGNSVEMNTIIPAEFQRDSTPALLPIPLRNTSNNESEYKALFSFSH